MGSVDVFGLPDRFDRCFRETVRNVRQNAASVKKDVRLIWTLTGTQPDPANVFAAMHVRQPAREKIFTLEQLRKNDL